MPATALTIAGSDSGGGAGIQADLKTFSALGVYGASAITLVTAQNTQGVQDVVALEPRFVVSQIRAVLDDIAIGAIKIGALGSGPIVEAVAAALADYDGPVVLDPVMVAKSGDPLLDDTAVGAFAEHLLTRADLLTPNLPEAARLTGRAVAETPDAVLAQGEALLGMGAKAVLMKGGHGSGSEAVDVLVRSDTPALPFSAPRRETVHTHGTGCTLSAAIAAHLAQATTLEQAVGAAKSWLGEAIRAGEQLGIGKGRGPVHHFHALWPPG
ncbi:MAG: bifunctional hydroxymethylpyrimidine kinase/phosphomethylpyrimidine kinase [Pseudomonadota bacterium]